MVRVYCAIGGFGTGGMTRATLARASLLARAGYDVTVLTLKPLADFEELCTRVVDEGLVDPSVALVNPYQHLADAYRESRGYVSLPDPPVRYVRRGTTGNRYRELGLDAAGDPIVRVVRSVADSRILRVDYLGEGRAVYRSERFADGVPDLVTDFADGARTAERYLSPGGFGYLELDYDPVSQQVREARSMDPATGQVARFACMDDLIRHFAAMLIGDSDEPAVLLCDDIDTPTYFRPMTSERLAVVPVIHENHLTPSGEVIPHLVPVLECIDDFPAVVCLTHGEAEDIASATGATNLHVIPNYVPAVDAPHTDPHRQPGRYDVALVSRLVQGKAADDALRAFAIVAVQVPDARLLVYGRGEEMPSLQTLATELGIAERVSWEGFTSTAVADLAAARVCITTSESEGFGMVIVESMAVGTPVVAMDCNYGPRDLIVDGVTGYVVADRDIEAFADRVCTLLIDDSVRADMSEAARAWVSEHLSARRITAQWRELFDSLA